MKTWLRATAFLLLLAGVLWIALWRGHGDRGAFAFGPERRGALTTSEDALVELDARDADARREEASLGEESLPPTPAMPATSPPTQAVQVIDAGTGRPVPAATVLHTTPSSSYEALDAAGKERYSLDTERFLSEFGESKVTDAEGRVVLPLDAALRIVVGRRGERYGVGLERKEEGPWILRIAPHRQLTVEVVDERNLPVAGVRILGEHSPLRNPFGMTLPLGTTDENGVVTHSFEEPESGVEPETLFVFASLPGGRHGEFAVNPAAPPAEPVRITLPAVGTVTVLVLDPTGVPLDPAGVGDPNIELLVVDPEASKGTSAPGAPLRVRQIARVEHEGRARFDNVALDKTLSIHAPTLFGVPIEFRGPRMDERDVLVEHRMHIDHPILAGRLLDTAGQPMRDTRFSILCRAQGELLSMTAGTTDPEGEFRTYLSERALGARPKVVVIYMAWKDMAPSRAVDVPIEGPLLAVVRVGDVVIPD